MVDVRIGPLRERDLRDANRIVRLAFGTFLGNLDADPPQETDGPFDTDRVWSRWRADPGAAFGAEVDGKLAGSIFATHWGSVGFFGPLSVHPDYWDQGLGGRLLEPVMALFDTWQVTHAGLYTFAQSPKHLHLYQRFGFWPRFLTAMMVKPVGDGATPPPWSRLSALVEADREARIADCAALTDSIYAGLDVAHDIRAAQTQKLGDTVLLHDGNQLVAFAVCHCGAGTEAGSGNCYVKFAAVRSGPIAGNVFAQLLAACEALAVAEGLRQVVAGVNLSHHEAYRAMLAAGFRSQYQGVAMHRPNEPGYCRPGVYVLDDWS